MKVKGMKMPKKMKKEPSVRRAKVGSLRGFTNAMREKGFGLGGSRDFTVRLAMMRRPRMRKAETRIVQGKPILGMRFWTRIGKITPPREDPLAMIPKARALLWKNQVATADSAG